MERGAEARSRVAALNALAALLPRPFLQQARLPVPAAASAAAADGYRQLHPHRRQLLRTLLAACDDRKRVVRQLAASVRTALLLFLASQPPP